MSDTGFLSPVRQEPGMMVKKVMSTAFALNDLNVE